VVVNEVNKSLSDRELLILVNERLTTLGGKLDEYRADNNSKYIFLQDELKCSGERLQTQIDAINIEVGRIKNVSYMQKGAFIFLGVLISSITAIGAFIVYLN
jgi:hypothetical protein